MLAQAAQSGWLPYLLFESPGWLMVPLAVIWAGTRITGRRTGNKRLMHLSWIALGLVAAVFASSYLVTTQREQLGGALKELLLAVEDKDFDAVRTLVDEQATIAYTGKENARPSFMKDELTREEMIGRLDQVRFDDIILIGSSAALDKQRDHGITGMRLNVKGTVGDYPGTQVSEWAVRWKYVDGRWVAIRLECIKIGADALFNRPE
ncbi:MAG: hypothetical protein AAGB26_15805 [Planctomycetota bacterium]